jgi:release factor glutamine methyltransferase
VSLTIDDALQQARLVLGMHKENVKLETEVLLAAVLGESRAYLLANNTQLLPIAAQQQYNAYLLRRKHGEPLAYILGYKEFWSLVFRVNKAVLIPRPETEFLVASILALWPASGQTKTIVELGTGSGAVAISIATERPNWQISATDNSAEALAVAATNSKLLAPNQLKFYHGSWYKALPELKFDAIISNPPYLSLTEWQENSSELAFEPKTALVAADDGFADLVTIISNAHNYLVSGGHLLLEHADHQATTVRRYLELFNYAVIAAYSDLQGLARVIVAQKIA